VLIDAGVVRGRTLTSWPNIKTDVRNEGGNWVNEEVVVDNGLVTSRKPDDIPAFNKKMVEEFCERETRPRKKDGCCDAGDVIARHSGIWKVDWSEKKLSALRQHRYNRGRDYRQ
jgi:DJ-1/PfpI family protein